MQLFQLRADWNGYRLRIVVTPDRDACALLRWPSASPEWITCTDSNRAADLMNDVAADLTRVVAWFFRESDEMKVRHLRYRPIDPKDMTPPPWIALLEAAEEPSQGIITDPLF